MVSHKLSTRFFNNSRHIAGRTSGSRRRRRRWRIAFPLNHRHQRFVYLRQHIRRQVIFFPLRLLHSPIRLASLRRSPLRLSHFLEIPHQVIPLVVALVLAPETPVLPAVIFHPLPPQLRRLPPLSRLAQSLHPPLVVHFLGLDQNHRFLEVPVPLPVIAQHASAAAATLISDRQIHARTKHPTPQCARRGEGERKKGVLFFVFFSLFLL